MAKPDPLFEEQDTFEEQETDAAASEAAAIGGHPTYRNIDEAHRPLVEAGEGVAEGFELAEQDLVDVTEGTEGGHSPLRQAFSPEPEAEASVDDYGEADFEPSAETRTGDR